MQGIDRTDGMKWFTGSVERVIPTASNMQQPFNIGQFPIVNVDIVANIDGKQREFRGVPGTNSIADFGEDSVILADNKDALYNYAKSLLRISEEATDSDNIKKHERWKQQFKETGQGAALPVQFLCVCEKVGINFPELFHQMLIQILHGLHLPSAGTLQITSSGQPP